MSLLKTISLLTVSLAVLAGCAKPPGSEQLDLGHQSTVKGNWNESIDVFTQALNVAKDKKVFMKSYSRRCEAYLWQGKFEAALEDCNSAIRAVPDSSGYPYAVRARLFANMGQYEWALEDYDEAIILGGAIGNNSKVMAYGGKARIFATSTDNDVRDGELAVQFAEKAVEFENLVSTPAYKILHRDTLAAAYASAGRFDDAVKAVNDAVGLVRDNGWGAVNYDGRSFMDILNDHLRQFEGRKPLTGGIY